MHEQVLQARLALEVKDQELAQRHASGLREMGFDITKVAPRGVSFSGPVKLFEQTFSSKMEETLDGPRFKDLPLIPKEIAEKVESVYFPTMPTFYGKTQAQQGFQ